MRAALNAEDNSNSGQPLDLDAIEEYLEEQDEEDPELIEEFKKTCKEQQERQKKVEDDILKSAENK